MLDAGCAISDLDDNEDVDNTCGFTIHLDRWNVACNLKS